MNPTSALTPGWHLYPGADTCWRLAGPDGSFVRVTGPQDVLAAVSRGRRVSGDEDLREALATLGAIVAPTRMTSTSSARVLVAGDDLLVRAAIALIESQDVQVVGESDQDAQAYLDKTFPTFAAVKADRVLFLPQEESSNLRGIDGVEAVAQGLARLG